MVKAALKRKIRLLLIDDHTLFREGVARLLSSESDMKLVAHCGTLRECVATLAEESIDVVLLDLDLGNERGADFFRRANELGYKGRVLILTGGVDPEEAARLLAQGAVGIFLKHNRPQLLSKSIRRVVAGEVWLDQSYVQALLKEVTQREDAEQRRTLTQRQREVLRGVFEGLANKEIASHLQVSEAAVKATLQQLFQKTGVRTRSQLVRIALEQYRDQL